MNGSRQMRHIHRSSTRLVAMLLVGLLVGTVAGVVWGWAFPVITGWSAASVTYIVWVWLTVGRMDSDTTASHATLEDPSARVVDLLVLLAGLGSLGAIVFLLVAEQVTDASHRGLLAALAVVSVGLSWALVHTLYTLRYASLYYGKATGGIDFNQDEAPSYGDFAYLSFTLGMTYQVSDTNLQNHAIRMTALRHALLSFPFGSGILATVVNLVAGLSF